MWPMGLLFKTTDELVDYPLTSDRGKINDKNPTDLNGNLHITGQSRAYKKTCAHPWLLNRFYIGQRRLIYDLFTIVFRVL